MGAVGGSSRAWSVVAFDWRVLFWVEKMCVCGTSSSHMRIPPFDSGEGCAAGCSKVNTNGLVVGPM